MNKKTYIKQLTEKIQGTRYEFCFWKSWDYTILKNITYKLKPGKWGYTYNDITIMADTETSKKRPNQYETLTHRDGTIERNYIPQENHVVCWTISLRAADTNLCTLWGRKPSDFTKCVDMITGMMRGEKTIIYFHNLSYDYIFLRKFFSLAWGFPCRELSTKPYYPVLREYPNGVIIKDSLILAQRKLEKWADDLDVEHKKQVGKWDYNKIRSQGTPLTAEELEYIEGDTLAGVECLDALKQALKKDIGTLPATATGIVREDIKKAGKVAGFHNRFTEIAPDLHVQQLLEMAYHGGFTHANRHCIGQVKHGVECRDFASSYPYVLLSEKYPMERFHPLENKSKDYILRNSNDYAFLIKFVAVGIELKDPNFPMPPLQMSKCIKTINAVVDNGRILCADYIEIELTEMDLSVIDDLYKMQKHCCCDVYVSKKDYLPRWLTDKIFEYFTKKTQLKGDTDKVAYDLAKAKLNSIYGLHVQKPIADDISEDPFTGKYLKEEGETEEKYGKYLTRKDSFLCYQWGCWCTAYAFRNIFELGKCIDFARGDWLYTDTDSCYSDAWDEEKLERYNAECTRKIKANGYRPVEKHSNGKIYNLGVAEFDGAYSEFVALGAKRYCARDKETGKLKITVAGVPKKTGVKCLNDDITNFKKGFIFDGETTGKLTHHYNLIDEIYVDEEGNETGDSVDLSPCDYLLDDVENPEWETLEILEIGIQVYGE